MSEGHGIAVQREEGVTRVTLMRPEKGNALSAGTVLALADAVEACHTDGTRCLLIDAAGSNFCTGFDLSDLDAETDDSLLARFVRVELLLQRVHRAPFMTAVLAHGKTWGAGADLVAACQVRWARADASFAFPGAGFGLVLGTGRLGALVGATLASDWIQHGRTVDAAQAATAGLVQYSAPTLDVDTLQAALRQRMARLDDITLRSVADALLPRSRADDAADLERLVRSAARPGLRQRILAYRAASRPPK